MPNASLMTFRTVGIDHPGRFSYRPGGQVPLTLNVAVLNCRGCHAVHIACSVPSRSVQFARFDQHRRLVSDFASASHTEGRWFESSRRRARIATTRRDDDICSLKNSSAMCESPALWLRLSCSPGSGHGSKSYDDAVWETVWFAALIGAIFGVGVVSHDLRVTKEARW